MTSVAANEETKESFETALSRLEQIVGALEKGDLSLEDSLKLYEEGIGRARFCQERLEEAESKIEVLSQDARLLLDRAAKPEPSR
ncbi:MAG: exodeoxyribonuclease VII small subunit [Vicinamibacteria bacterium]|nr:exodeoxyribonuclease VII small subunit [Vicinamibacteria bacterium]